MVVDIYSDLYDDMEMVVGDDHSGSEDGYGHEYSSCGGVGDRDGDDYGDGDDGCEYGYMDIDMMINVVMVVDGYHDGDGDGDVYMVLAML